MINAPQGVKDALASGDVNYANLISIDLGDAYGTGNPVVLHLTDYGHAISFGGNTYTPDNNLNAITGISRKASTGSDSVDIVFSVTDPVLIDVIRSERYVNQPTSIDRVIMQDGVVLNDFSIPIRTAWGLSHSISGDEDDRLITLTVDSVLGNLDGDNGWYAINSSHEQRYAGDKIMRHSSTVMTEEQKKKYTTNFKGVINSEIKPPALPKVYGYKNVELVPICMLKHRKSHSSYRHYFTTLIYVVNIGECDYINLRSLRKDDEAFDGKIVTDNSSDVGGWSVRIRTPADAELGSLISESNGDLRFWFEWMDEAEKNRLQGMYGKGLTLLFLKNRNRDDWLTTTPKLTLPVRASRVYDPRTGLTVFSRNPALQYADFLRSTEYGAGKRGIPVSDTNIADLANHFDQIPDSSGNDGINRILIDVQVDTAQPLVDNMNIWMEGVRLYTSDYYGKFNIRVETKSAVSWIINEDELEDFPNYDSGEFTDRINQLSYSIKQLVPDTSEDAEVGDLMEVEVEAVFPEDGTLIHTTWLAEDGGIPNFESERLSYVTELEQAYYWAMVDSRISRQPRTMEIKTGITGWLSEVGDVIQFTSELMDMTDELWRVDEVSEDDGQIALNLVAYDNNFYTPDPDAIPAPAGEAQPPTGVPLPPVSGLAVIEQSGIYYLTWTPPSSANVNWYAVEVIKEGVTLIVDEPRVAQPPLMLETITVGSYEARVTSIGTQDESDEAVLSFDINLPETPTLSLSSGNFSIEVRASVAKTYLGSTFNLRINDVDDLNTAQEKGTGGSFVVTNLIPDTDYYVWVRTINVVGISDWATGTIKTLNDNTTLVEFINLDRESIIDDAVGEMQDQIEDIVGANPQQQITDMVNNIWDIMENEEDIITEENVRKTQGEKFTAEIGDNKAEITRVEQVTSDALEAQATSIVQLQSDVGGNTAYIGQVDTTYASITSAQATQITNLTASVNNKAEITFVNQVKDDVDGNASAISSLQTRVTDTEGDISSAQLILSTHTDEIDGLNSRAFLGTTTGSGDVERITGIYIQDGQTLKSTIEFRTDTFQLSNTAGQVKFYWDDADDAFVFQGKITASKGVFSQGLSADFNQAYLEIGQGKSGSPMSSHAAIGTTSNSITMDTSMVITGGGNGIQYNVTDPDEYHTFSGGVVLLDGISGITASMVTYSGSTVATKLAELESRIAALEP